MERSGVHGKSLPQVSASRRDASVVDAISYTTVSSLRDSFYLSLPSFTLFFHNCFLLSHTDLWEALPYLIKLQKNLKNSSIFIPFVKVILNDSIIPSASLTIPFSIKTFCKFLRRSCREDSLIILFF